MEEELKNVEINDEELENVSGGMFDGNDYFQVENYIHGQKNPIVQEIAQKLFNDWDRDRRPHTYNQFKEEVEKRYKTPW